MSAQPPPCPGRQRVTQALIDELLGREAKGIATYGRSLETFNGRNALRDALDEALDLSQYLMQAILEREELEREVAALRLQLERLQIERDSQPPRVPKGWGSEW